MPQNATIHQVQQANHPRDIKPLDITGQIVYATPIIFGGHADVSRGVWHRVDIGYMQVAVKVIRSPAAGSAGHEVKRYDKRQRREVQVWKRLRHQNIVHLLGTSTDFPWTLQDIPRPAVALVSPWMERGNLKDLLKLGSMPISDLLQLLCGVAEGLDYLHSKSVIHADLHPGNILIHNDGHPCLTDFGLSSINAEFAGTSYFSMTMCAAIRWCAPELIPPQEDVEGFKPRLTLACDIFSLGNVILQVLSNKLPYYNIESDTYVLIQMRNHRPKRPLHALSDIHWEFIQSCWGITSFSRPTAGMVHQSLLSLCKE
ncbi:kinase-like protein [Athelia psychrophila]|uniref:Kinase-like protein n=1 Tax=Athelia psychrophila TaxID=1759441 RepID=A0A166ITU8_9AGAM|nr:kinase-like protein [Fibularhizoctonia sp. CBS 109695]